MRYEAHVSAYDVMDQISVGCVVRDIYGATGERPEVVLAVGTILRGEGISDPREWLRDALVAILEVL